MHPMVHPNLIISNGIKVSISRTLVKSTYVVGAQKKHLNEMVPLSTQNIC